MAAQDDIVQAVTSLQTVASTFTDSGASLVSAANDITSKIADLRTNGVDTTALTDAVAAVPDAAAQLARSGPSERSGSARSSARRPGQQTLEADPAAPDDGTASDPEAQSTSCHRGGRLGPGDRPTRPSHPAWRMCEPEHSLRRLLIRTNCYQRLTKQPQAPLLRADHLA